LSRTALAFMSYVNLDDQHENGRLTQFREQLSGEVRMQTGEPFEIFQDRKDIAWGQQWQKRVNESLDAITFLIPIITPGFFKSKACRDELERFIEREKELGRGDLILPVYYVNCLVLSDKTTLEQDSLEHIVAARQYADWRELRFEEFTSPQVRKPLANMAEQILAALKRNKTVTDIKQKEPQPKPAAKNKSPTFVEDTQQSIAPLDIEPAIHKDDKAQQGSSSPVLAAEVVRSKPHILDRSPLFRDVVVRKFQAVPADDRPRPAPLRTEELPPWALPDPTLRHVNGWHVRLRIGVTYRLRWDLAPTETWIETEFVLFQHVTGDSEGVFDHYERIASAGAFATDQWPDQITPTAESCLIGCYGKLYIGWDAPWYEMVPHRCTMKDDGHSLELLFTRSPDSGNGKGSLEEDTHPALWLEFSTVT